MTKEKISNYLTDIPKPAAPQVEGQEMLRLALLSARRSSIIGAVLIALPGVLICFFFLSNAFHVFPGLIRWLAGRGTFLPLPWRAVVVFVFLVGFPFVAVAINLLSVTWFRYFPSKRELVITVRMKWPNLLIAVIGSALAAFYVVHLLADTVLGKG